jgi:hypothetical protein
LIKVKSLHKKLSAAINNKIEETMAVRAKSCGKLTIMQNVAKKGSTIDNKK